MNCIQMNENKFTVLCFHASATVIDCVLVNIWNEMGLWILNKKDDWIIILRFFYSFLIITILTHYVLFTYNNVFVQKDTNYKSIFEKLVDNRFRPRHAVSIPWNLYQISLGFFWHATILNISIVKFMHYVFLC